MALVILAGLCRCLSIDDLAIGILTGQKFMKERIIPMAHTWYQLVPEVDIYTDDIPEELWPAILSANRSNLFFHKNNAFPHHLHGTEFELDWNGAQSRHLHAMADLWERHPDKQFYFFCDDDTFVLPSSLLDALSRVNSNAKHIYGHVSGVIAFGNPFFPDYPRVLPWFNHGGSGFAVARGLMSVIGPKLRNCSSIFEIVNLGSDIRLGACASHIGVGGARLKNNAIHVAVRGFNPDMPHVDREKILPGRQVTFHHAERDATMKLFETAATVDGDRYWDWAFLAFQPIWVGLGGPGRPQHLVVGHVICPNPRALRCAHAMTGITKIDHPMANFTQKFSDNLAIYYRCNPEMDAEEIGYFGEAPPPETGIILDIKCPKPISFVVRSNGIRHVTSEEMGWY
jgi:hypothetical protein